MLLHSHKQVISCLFDFAVDGGGIGVINLGGHIPSNALCTYFAANAIIAPASGGLATISFGYQAYTSIGTFVSPVAFMPATPFAAFLLGTPIRGVDLNLNPIKFGPFNAGASGLDIVMAIGGDTLTAGKIQCWLEITENLV